MELFSYRVMKGIYIFEECKISFFFNFEKVCEEVLFLYGIFDEIFWLSIWLYVVFGDDFERIRTIMFSIC